MSKLTPPTDNDRLHIFESVQFDPELWALVQQKYDHFEDLHREIADLQNQRGDLLNQLSKVNESIAKLQQQLVTLSGQEAEDSDKEQAEAAAKEEVAQPALMGSSSLDEDWSAPSTHSSSAKSVEVEPTDESDDDNQETVVGLEPLEFEGVDDGNEEQEKKVAESADKIDIAPYEPAVASEPAEPVVPSIQPAAVEPSVEAAPAAELPVQEGTAAEESAPVPAEVQELQQLFDRADDQRRQSDSALKLVQLYDGKAETFFAAMCRSHQQSGLSEADARNEAVKDVQTMIATAKHNSTAPAEPKKADEQAKPNGKSGGMRRLFSHS